jgi:uncharacterized protein
VKKIFAILSLLVCLAALGAETIPPAPAQYFNDYAGVVSAATAAQLNQRLAQFERDSASQIMVVVYPHMQSDSSIEDYTVRVAQSWKVGQQDKNNGAVLFVFTEDRKMFLQTGYGLEGVLPDALCKRIIEDEIKPWFKSGNYDNGLTAGVNAILAAAKGEYKGTGQTVAERDSGGTSHGHSPGGVLTFLAVIVAIIAISSLRRGNSYSRRGWSSGGWVGGWSSGGGGGWSGGGGGGGGGGFSGGGGSFGGGGAGGSW